MGIPIIQELWDGVRWLIDFFFNKIPRPLQFLIFLLFLLFFGVMISFMLHLSGIHCNSSKEVVKTDIFDVGTNIALIWEDSQRTFTQETLTICEVHPERCGQESECYFHARQLDNGLYETCNQSVAQPDCKYYLKDGLCHNCTNKEICFQESMFWIFCGNWHDVCIDNAYSYDTTLFDTFTGCGSACFVPTHYMWNQTSGLYECIDSDYCGVSATKIQNPIIDEKLLRADAELVYTTTEMKKNYKNLIYLKCDNDYNPRLTFFGVDIFDYKIWLFFAVIYVLVMLMFQLKK